MVRAGVRRTRRGSSQGGLARRRVRFLVDAQLPARLARFLRSVGHDALYTTELPDGNRTSDGRIAELADDEGRVVVTKDRDFRDGHLLARSPQRLLVGATGNITNAALLSLFGRISTRSPSRSRRPSSSSSVRTLWSFTDAAKTVLLADLWSRIWPRTARPSVLCSRPVHRRRRRPRTRTEPACRALSVRSGAPIADPLRKGRLASRRVASRRSAQVGGWSDG